MSPRFPIGVATTYNTASFVSSFFIISARLGALAVATLTLAACQSLGGLRPSSVDATAVRDIEQLLYLAATEPAPFTYRYRLQAAEKLSLGGQERAARRILEDISAARLGDEQYRAFTIQYADLLLRDKSVPEALALLRAPRLLPLLPRAEPAERLRLHQLRAKALLLNHQPLSAFKESIDAVELIADDNERRRYQQAIWEMLQNTSSAALRKRMRSGANNMGADARGWLELALLARDYERLPAEQKRAVNRWRGRHPQHIANREPPPELRLLRAEPRARIDAVTLLLPLGGHLSQAGVAVRDGFLGAWYRNQDSGPVVRIIDTSQGDVREHYRTAIEEHNADFVIGPLSKENVATLAKSRISVPTLALNTLAKGSAPKRMFLFGLDPGDELRQIVTEARARGWNYAMTLRPDEDWAQMRVENFTALWQELGGKITDVILPPDNRAASSRIIADALALDASKRRTLNLERLLQTNLHSAPRRREDVDFILLIADAPQARLLSPVLKYHRAGNLPALGVPKIYDHTLSDDDNTDLDGVTFIDAPWVLEPPALARTLSDLGEAKLTRMHALGVEAWHLLPWLEAMARDEQAMLYGASGRLSVDRQRRVRRHLLWAKIASGAPGALSPIAVARLLDPPQRLN